MNSSTTDVAATNTTPPPPHIPGHAELAFQDDVTGGLTQLGTLLGDAYAGSYFTPGDDEQGHFTFLFVGPEQLGADALAKWSIPATAKQRVSYRPAATTLSGLQRALATARSAILAQPEDVPVELGIDEMNNCVTAHVLTGHRQQVEAIMPATIKSVLCWSEGEVGGLL